MLPDVDIRFYAYKTHIHTHQLNIYWWFLCEHCRNNEDIECGVFQWYHKNILSSAWSNKHTWKKLYMWEG